MQSVEALEVDARELDARQWVNVQGAASLLGLGVRSARDLLFLEGLPEVRGRVSPRRVQLFYWRAAVRKIARARAALYEEAPPGYISAPEAVQRYGLSTSTLAYMRKSGRLLAVEKRRRTTRGRVIKVFFFDESELERMACSEALKKNKKGQITWRTHA